MYSRQRHVKFPLKGVGIFLLNGFFLKQTEFFKIKYFTQIYSFLIFEKVETMDPLMIPQNFSYNESFYEKNASYNIYATERTLPYNMRFTEMSILYITIYGISFLIASVGNLTVFCTLSRGRHLKNRVSLIIWHLSIADLLVTFVSIPIEIVWRFNVQWHENISCKVMMSLRIFGMYLSNNILICVSLDRYFAVLHPLTVSDARRRSKKSLTVAWIVSIIYCIPQGYVYHVQEPKDWPGYFQCVTFYSFPSPLVEILYHIYCLVVIYFIPLSVIAFVYSRILCEISQKSRESHSIIKKSNSNGTPESSASTQPDNKMRLRRSDMTNIERARNRTLMMTIKIVTTFIICWTPYIFINIWILIDPPEMEKEHIDMLDVLQTSLFLLAQIGNPCANPLVYGSYVINLKKECSHFFSSLSCTTRKSCFNAKVIETNLGSSKFQKSEIKSPGVSKQIVHTVRHAVQGLFKVGSGQTKSSTIVEKMPLREIKIAPKSPVLDGSAKLLEDASSDCKAIMEYQLSNSSEQSEFQRHTCLLMKIK